MQLTINGKEVTSPNGLTIAEIVVRQGFNPDVIVIEYNQKIVRKEEWKTIVLDPRDCLEVVSFVGGG